jgi:hypothetical protein
MPTYDPVTQSPMHIGPTIDTDAEQSAMKWRSEPHEIMARKGTPIRLAMKTRPVTHRVNHGLRAGSAVVLSRMGNDNPAAAGRDDATSVWSVSDPYLSGDAEDAQKSKNWLLAIGLGIGLGVLASRFR